MLDIIKNRRSIRTFKNQPVEADKIKEVIKAGMQAPSAMNQQPWEVVVVDDQNILNKLSETTPYTKLLANAPIGIVLLMEKERLKAKGYEPQDMSACCENMLLEAVNQQLGAVWMGVYPHQDRCEYIADLLDIPNNLVVFNLIALGYSEEENKYVDRYNDLKVHHNKYQKPQISTIDKDGKLSLIVNNKEVAYLEYHQENDHIYCVDHTFAEPRYRSQGWASILVKQYVAKLVDENCKTKSNCSYISKKLEGNELLVK